MVGWRGLLTIMLLVGSAESPLASPLDASGELSLLGGYGITHRHMGATRSEVPDLAAAPVDLASYDALLGGVSA